MGLLDTISPLVLLVAEDDLLDQRRGLCGVSRVLPLSASLPDGTRRLLMGKASLPAIRMGLAAPFEGFVELGTECLSGGRCRCLSVSRAGGILLSLLTATAYDLDILTLLREALAAGFPRLSKERLGAIETCLGEAIGNAIIHGNLAIGSELRTTREGMMRMSQLIKERLADPRFGQRRLEILAWAKSTDSLEITVSDQGGGYDVEAAMARGADIDAKCGRGLGIIRDNACAVHCMDGGRTLVLEF